MKLTRPEFGSNTGNMRKQVKVDCGQERSMIVVERMKVTVK